MDIPRDASSIANRIREQGYIVLVIEIVLFDAYAELSVPKPCLVLAVLVCLSFIFSSSIGYIGY